MVVCFSLQELQRIKQWHVAHRAEHPLEYQLWDLVLFFWVMGCVGWLPAVVFDAWWALPLCMLALLSPNTYVNWRARAHAQHRLRCEWLAPPGP
ncbi:MAG TPA: hypothetical protein VGE70_06400 [Burkholderiaceae bacterium]